MSLCPTIVSNKFVWRFYANIIRSSHRRCSVRKGALRNFAKVPGKHLCQSLFCNKVAGPRLSRRCFSVNFAKFLRTPFLQDTSGRLLLDYPKWQRFIQELFEDI